MEQCELDPTVDEELNAAMALGDLAGMERRSTKRVKKESPDKSSPDKSLENYDMAEREEKKLRRVLANREAARQTILRRQALREELMRKVADLSLENENLKMEKERAVKEHLLLKDTNRQLKEEVDRATKLDNEKSEEVFCTQEEAPTTSSTTLPLMIYSASAMVPSVRQSWSTHYEQGDGGPSCPWFFPLISVPGSCTANEEPNDEQHSSRDSQTTFDNEEKEEVSCSLTLNTRVSQQVSNSKRRILQPCPNKALPISSSLADVPSKEVESKGASHEMSVDAAAAAPSAAARKRRKELRKLKQGCRGLSRATLNPFRIAK